MKDKEDQRDPSHPKSRTESIDSGHSVSAPDHDAAADKIEGVPSVISTEEDLNKSDQSRFKTEDCEGSCTTMLLASGDHEVVLTVTLAMAVPSEPDMQTQLKEALSKSTVDTPHVQNFFHLEYNLLPGEEPFKTDVVTYGVACKVFMEKYEAQVIKTWQEKNVTWTAWAHSQKITVTRELLLKLIDHTVELRLWNTKDRCSTRAGYDKPKAFRLPEAKPGEQPEDIGGVKAMVTNLLKRYMKQQPRKGKPVRPLLSEEDPIDYGTKATTSKFTLPFKANKIEKTGDTEDKAQKQKKPVPASKDKAKAQSKDDKDVRRQVSDHSRLVAEQIKKFGICMVPLKFSLLFGEKEAVGRLDSPVAGVMDLFLLVSLDSPLLSVAQQEYLNPLFIQVCSATNLPDSPVSYADLRLKCNPVYCKYTFFNEPEHRTSGREHDKDLYWNDTQVFLLGTMEPGLLKEYFNGPGLKFEVHDRDRNAEQLALKPAIFGDDPEDDQISSVQAIQNRRTLHNPFSQRDHPWDPYGVALFDFLDLLRGCTFMEVSLPVLNCQEPDILGPELNASHKLAGFSSTGPVTPSFRAGHYVKKGTTLKVRIRLAFPIANDVSALNKTYIADTREVPFNRIIFMFDHNNWEMLRNIQILVMSFNARALGLDTSPQNVINASLTDYKLTIVQQCKLDLDIVTGFHVSDGQRHICLLEGFRYKAIPTLWETLPQSLETDDRVLYNSDLGFSTRLYGPLDVDLCTIKLHQPISVIVQEPLLYIRDLVKKPAFDALMKLDQIKKTRTMSSVVRNNLFPTCEMVASLQREFGVPLTDKDVSDLKPSFSVESQVSIEVSAAEPQQTNRAPPLSTYNQTYQDYLETDKPVVNYVQANIDHVKTLSEIKTAERAQNQRAYLTLDIEPAYNYSIQHLNSTELAIEQLRQYLRQLDSTALYAYNLEFLSGMFCPVNIELEKKEKELLNRSRWRTNTGWTNPGQRSLRECHAHPQHPDQARLDSLREKWIENILHANILHSPLDRGHYPWSDRHIDWDLYTKPPADVRDQVPLSVFSDGALQEEDKKAAKLSQLQEWRSRVVTDDLRQYFHRLLPASEMTDKGFNSSNQLDRLQGLLKDPPRKHGLEVNGKSAYDISPLAVVNDPRLDSISRTKGLISHSTPETATVCGFQPGEFSRPWTMNNNHIPCYNYEHETFKQKKGQDFNAHYRSRAKMSSRPILPLKPEEKNNNLFNAQTYINPFQVLPPVRPTSQVGLVSSVSDQPLQNVADRMTSTTSQSETKGLEIIGLAGVVISPDSSTERVHQSAIAAA